MKRRKTKPFFQIIFVLAYCAVWLILFYAIFSGKASNMSIETKLSLALISGIYPLIGIILISKM